jgi:hypothetical protein
MNQLFLSFPHKTQISIKKSNSRNMKFSILALLGVFPVTTGMISSPHPFNEIQPDGETIALQIRGDPYDSYISDMEGTYE